MAEAKMRTHVVLPKELVESVDELVGSRARSRFFAEAVQEKLAKARLAQAARRVAGSLADVEVPGWETSKSAADWVRAARREDETSRERRASGR